MAKIDLDDLKSVLGVGNLYPDEMLQQIANAADTLIDGMLTYNRSSITQASCAANVATFETATTSDFYVGAQVVVTGCGYPFDGTFIINGWFGNYFTVALTTGITIDVRRFKPFGKVILDATSAQYDLIPAVREAALAVAVEIFAQRVSPGGMSQGVDFTPTAHKLGRALLNRVHGLLAPYMDMSSRVG